MMHELINMITELFNEKLSCGMKVHSLIFVTLNVELGDAIGFDKYQFGLVFTKPIFHVGIHDEGADQNLN